ncbi:MAG: hypothetical protein WBN15_15110 [Polyangiales bacterium]
MSANPPDMFSKPASTSEKEKMNVYATGSPLPSTGMRYRYGERFLFR